MLLLPDLDIRRKARDTVDKFSPFIHSVDLLEQLIADVLAEERNRCAEIVAKTVRTKQLRGELLNQIMQTTY